MNNDKAVKKVKILIHPFENEIGKFTFIDDNGIYHIRLSDKMVYKFNKFEFKLI